MGKKKIFVLHVLLAERCLPRHLHYADPPETELRGLYVKWPANAFVPQMLSVPQQYLVPRGIFKCTNAYGF